MQALRAALAASATRTKYVIADNQLKIMTAGAIIGSVGAFGLGIYAAIKKLPAIQAEYEAAIDSIEKNISAPQDEAKQALADFGDEDVAIILGPESDEIPGIEQQREYIESLYTVCETCPQLEAAYVTKARIQRAGKIIWAFTPAVLSLLASIMCSLGALRVSTRKILSASAAITALTAEAAQAGKDTPILTDGEKPEKDLVKVSVDEEEVKRRAFVRIYDSHLLRGMDVEECLKMGAGQLHCFETHMNTKLQASKDGRMYFGDVLRPLGFPTDDVGQNTGWICRDHPSEYDGYISFGCWKIEKDPVTNQDIKVLDPECITPEGAIILNFNVEGGMEFLLAQEKKRGRKERSTFQPIAGEPVSEVTE